MAFQKTRQQIEAMVFDQVIPGVSYGLITGSRVETNYLGCATWQPQRQALMPGQYYDLASLTKVMTTTVMILKMIHEKILTLQTPVHQLLPEFLDERIQVRHLLTHTSGIAGYIPHRNELPPAQLKAALLGLGVGSGFLRTVKYTDVGLIFLGFIIENHYHYPVQQVLTKEVIDPLNLNNTTFTPPKLQCVPTTYDPVLGLLQGVVHDPKARILGEHCASAGLFSTLTDVLKFSQWLLGQYVPPSAPLDQGMIEALFQNYSGLIDQPRSLGWDLRRNAVDGHWLLYHTGFTGTFIIVDRVYQNALVVLSNRIHPSGHNDRFLEQRERIVQSFCDESKEKPHVR